VGGAAGSGEIPKANFGPSHPSSMASKRRPFAEKIHFNAHPIPWTFSGGNNQRAPRLNRPPGPWGTPPPDPQNSIPGQRPEKTLGGWMCENKSRPFCWVPFRGGPVKLAQIRIFRPPPRTLSFSKFWPHVWGARKKGRIGTQEKRKEIRIWF